MMGPGLKAGYIDPQMNNQPLLFNSSKGKPPMPVEGSSKKDDGSMGAFAARLLKIPPSERQNSTEMDESMTLPPIPPDSMGGGGGGNMGGMGGGNMMIQGGGQGFFGGPMGGIGPMMGPLMGPGPGPDMMSMGNMMMFGGMGWGGGPMSGEGPLPMPPPKEIIRLKSCVLYPPPPNAPPPTTRERPPGCRTIFVGGLPETAAEDLIQEVFQEFGAITNIRKSKKKNFAHVRFEDETMVDRALFLSGYRMKVEDKDDKQNTGRLHVDFAMARDDQYEFECKQRSLMRDMRHRQRLEEERMRPPSPPPITQYSDYEATALLEQLKSDEEFMKASQVLLTWLERGDVSHLVRPWCDLSPLCLQMCEKAFIRADEEFMKASQVLLTWLERGDVSRRNINSFYGMIQCTNSHIRRLLMEKQAHEEELTKMKEKFKIIFEGILRQFDQIERIFTVAQKQRNWDHFTKAQRKNVELWLKQAKEIKQNQQEEFFSGRQEDEMEMSDDDEGPSTGKKKKIEYSENITNQYAEMAGKLNQINLLKDENDSLKCQIEAYKNELEVIKQEGQGSSDGKEVKALQLAMQGMQQQLIQARNELSEQKKKSDQEKADLEKQLQAEKDRQAAVRDSGTEDSSKVVSGGNEAGKLKTGEDVISSTGLHVTDKEAKLIGLVCCFLHVHPTGASLDYIWSYLHRLGISCRVSELETLLEKIPVIFRQEVTGVGATIERRWHFSGLDPDEIPCNLTSHQDPNCLIFKGLNEWGIDQIERIFTVAQKQRNWDHFTKAQRKNVELWLKQAKEIKQNQQEEFFSGRQENEMEMSDDDEGPSTGKKKKIEYSENITNQYAEMAGKLNQINLLKDENDSLKCQIEAYKNELEVMKQEGQGSSDGKEVKALQLAMQGMQQQLIQARNELSDQKKKSDQEKADLEKQLQTEKDRQAAVRDSGTEDSSKVVSGGSEAGKVKTGEDVISSTGLHVTDKEAKLIGLVCCFLHVHPTGASLDYIWSYLHRLGISCRVSELETLLEKIPVIFRQEVTGVGATIERRWHFSGYRNLPLT